MSDHTEFSILITKVRAGDESAVSEFLLRYEPYIRRTIRRRLIRSHVGPLADSNDVCQSVLGSVLIRLAAGEYEVESPDELHKLLGKIVRNKIADLARREHAECRDRTITVQLSDSANLPDGAEKQPDRITSARELIEEVRKRLTDPERILFDLRRLGQRWEEIVVQLGENAVILRKRLSRAVKRVAVELHLEE